VEHFAEAHNPAMDPESSSGFWAQLAKSQISFRSSRPSENLQIDQRSVDMSKIFALVILLICILNGCQTIREKASGPEFEKAKLTAIIKAQLAREDQATLQAVTVDVDDGVVKLKGTVSSAEKKAKAEEITRKVSGVKSVVNNLEVKP
jgi:translation elongation factor EF-1beta